MSTMQPEPGPTAPWGPPPATKKRRAWLAPTLTGAVALVAGIGIGGASSGKTSGSTATSTVTVTQTATAAAGTSSSSSPASSSTSAPPSSSSSGEVPSGTVEIGPDHGYHWSDGLTIQMTKMAAFKPSSTSAGANPGDTGVKITVVITNGSKETWDPLAIASATGGPDGVTLPAVFDEGIDGDFTTNVPAGGKATAIYAFAVPKGVKGKIVVQFQPGLTYTAVLFSGTLP